MKNVYGRFLLCLLFFTSVFNTRAGTDKIISEEKVRTQNWIQNQPASLSGRQVKFLENKGPDDGYGRKSCAFCII